MSLLAPFHPAVQTWFQDRLGEPTPPQREGWPAIREGRNTLIAAPTGSGKTLAAFLSAIDSLIRQGPALADETHVLYVSPLRALSNDVQKNLQGPLAEIRALDPSVPEVRVLVRTGDTPAARAHGDDPPAAAHPRDDAGVALSPPDERGRPEDAAHGLDGHRRRDPRAHPRQERQPSRTFARAPRAPRRPAHPARGPLGHAEAARRGRPLPRGRRARLHARRRRHVPHTRYRDRGPAVPSRDRLLARAVAGNLRTDRGACPRAPDDARLREHAQDGRAHLGAAHAPARGRRGDESPRQPLESAAPRRRAAPEGRRAPRARRDGFARARHRRRRRGPRDPGRRDALDRDVPPTGRPRRTRAPEDPEGTALPSHPRRTRRRGSPSRVDPPRRSRSDPDAAAPPRHPRAADRRDLRR